MIAVYQPSVSKATYQKAERLAEMVPMLPRHRDKATGIEYVVIPSSDDPEHTGRPTNGLKCLCDGFTRNAICSHSIAFNLALQRETAARIAAAQELRKQNGKCKQTGCVRTAARLGGRCFEHNAVLCDRLGI